MNRLKPFSILYAEDDKQIRDGYINYFKTLFESVYSASDGREAFNMYKEYQPDILLFDINMPYINGLELVEKIREDDSKVKIVLLTAYQDEERLLQAIPLGLTKYLKKPVKKRDLENVLLKLIISLEQNIKDDSIVRLSNTLSWNMQKYILLDNNIEIHLTKNEIILFNILLSKKRIHYSLDDLLEEFWIQLNQKEMSHNSIRNIIKRLKVKLPDNTIENHYGIGYKLCIAK